MNSSLQKNYAFILSQVILFVNVFFNIFKKDYKIS